MISEKEAQEVIEKFVQIRDLYKSNPTEENKKQLVSQEKNCLENFKYIVTMRANKYKNFSNYDDLVQDGMEALMKSLKTYKTGKGSIFWWIHKYVDTKIFRSANSHTTIKYPIKFAKDITPHKESLFPTLIEHRYNPDKLLEEKQSELRLEKAISQLSEIEKNILNLTFGLDSGKPMTLDKASEQLNISYGTCKQIANSAIKNLKKHLKKDF